ncbi:MAG: hypothetical protein WA823_08620 [Candidatus Acidiferrales bacterium]
MTTNKPGDDVMTVVAISLIAEMVTNVVHEGLGHAATALATGTTLGVLSTVEWAGGADTRLVAAAGTLANLAAAFIFWLAWKTARQSSVRRRYFLFLGFTFNVLAGTGYFFFSGVTGFGDGAIVMDGLHPQWFWRVLLGAGGLVAYFAAALIVGRALVRYVGVSRNDLPRLRHLTLIPYLSAVGILCLSALFNPAGIQLMWKSALPGTAGGHSGLLWLRFYIPRKTAPERPCGAIERSHAWIATATALSLVFVYLVGRGITLRR